MTVSCELQLRDCELSAGDGVAAVIANSGNTYTPRQVCLWSLPAPPTPGQPAGHGQLDFLEINNAMCDPLCYPILWPHGTPGWNDALRLRNIGAQERMRDKLKPEGFYRYQFQIRDTPAGPGQPVVFERDVIHRTFALFHQYAIDSFLKVDDERLELTCLSNDTTQTQRLRKDKFHKD